MSRIFIVGAGFVGLATGRALRAIGHQVTYVDTDPGRVDELTSQGLDARAILSLTDEGEAYIVISLPTPAGAGSGRASTASAGYDLSILRAGVRSIGRALASSSHRHTVVMRSTVPPRTTDGMVRHLLERISGKRAGDGFDLVCHPEFLRPGHADHDAQWPVLTVVGGQDRRVADRVARDLAPFGGVHHLVGSATAAEMVKCVSVLQRSVNVAFWQEISHVARRLDLDPELIARTLGVQLDAPDAYDTKDVEGFLATASDAGVAVPMLTAAAATTKHARQLLARRSVPRPDRRSADRADRSADPADVDAAPAVDAADGRSDGRRAARLVLVDSLATVPEGPP